MVNHLVKENLKIYADMEGNTTGGSTIPPDILITPEKLNITIIDRPLCEKPSIIIIDLTIHWEERLQISREIKTKKHSPLISDIK